MAGPSAGHCDPYPRLWLGEVSPIKQRGSSASRCRSLHRSSRSLQHALDALQGAAIRCCHLVCNQESQRITMSANNCT